MQSYNLNQLNVLVIERHVGIHRTIREILRHFGTRAVWDTGCLKEAQELIEEKQPDLIFTGLAPAFDGIGLVKTIRAAKNETLRYLPIIMLSAYTDMKTVLEARDSGVNELLTKPFSATGIYKRICSLIEKKRYFVQCASFIGPDRRRRRLAWGRLERRAICNPL